MSVVPGERLDAVFTPADPHREQQGPALVPGRARLREPFDRQREEMLVIETVAEPPVTPATDPGALRDIAPIESPGRAADPAI